MRKLFIALGGVLFLGFVGWSLAANPVGKSGAAEKGPPAKKGIPSGKSAPAEKGAPASPSAPAEKGGLPEILPPEDEKRLGDFKTSLHHTGRGLAYWYGKEQQGLELLTGQPYEKLACKKCHVGSCEGCHQPVNKIKGQEVKRGAVNPETCLKCHDHLAALRQVMQQTKTEDVHQALGLTCLDCHTSREMHGDGQAYRSQKQAEAMDARCEKCHPDISNNYSHGKHWKKVACQACHTRMVVNRTNVQFEPLAREGKRVTLPETDWILLMEREGKLTAASLQTFVLPERKTFIMITPDGSHAISRSGRKCAECHGSGPMMQAQQGKINLSWLEQGEIRKGRGLFPVLAGAVYRLVYQTFQGGKWSVLDQAVPSQVQYAGYGGPVSEKFFRKMLKVKTEESEFREKKKKKK